MITKPIKESINNHLKKPPVSTTQPLDRRNLSLYLQNLCQIPKNTKSSG